MTLALQHPDPDDFDALNAAARQEAIFALGRKPGEDPALPWQSLDDAVGALVRGMLLIVGSYTGNGKTALMLNLARHYLQSGVSWAYFGLELEAGALVSLLAALDCGLPRWAVIENKLTSAQRTALLDSIRAIGRKSAGMHFVPDPSLSPDEVVARIRLLVRKRGTRLVIVDHIHQLNYDGQSSTRTAVARGIRMLKEVSKETGITLIASAQLRREMGDKAQAYRTPALSDLMESSAIEQVADCVLMAHRQIRAGTLDQLRAFQRGDGTVSEQDFAEPNRLALTVRKHRFGRPLGVTVPLHLAVPSDRLTEPPVREQWDVVNPEDRRL